MAESYVGGFHAVTALIERADPAPREVLLASSRNDQRARALRALAERFRVPMRSVPRSDLDVLAPELRHQGVLAVVEAREFSGDDVLEVPATPDRLLLVLDGVQDPHNLGACLRSAEAAGVSAVIIPRDRAVSLTPVARSAAAGSAERIPLIAVTNLARSLRRLRELGYWVFGLSGDASDTLYQMDLNVPLVLVMGGEGAGLRRLTREQCDKLLKIPMRGEVESLNVSAAATVCLFETMRQRGV